MRDFLGSTLWRISAFERALDTGMVTTTSGGPGSSTVPGSMLGELRHLQADPTADDPLSAVAACMRHRRSLLLCFEQGACLWPVTLFPVEQVYHSPHDVAEVSALAALSQIRLRSADPPTVRAPAYQVLDDASAADKYRPLSSLLGALALYGPRADVLADIGGRAAYRLTPSGAANLAQLPGALGPAAQRLRREAASLRDIAGWPGMSVERASRLLNVLYLTGGLLVTRAHPSAREQPSGWRSLLGRHH